MTVQVKSDFEQFHKNNPNVYRKLVEFARTVKTAGFGNYGIAALFERLRWHYSFEVKATSSFKLRNDYKPLYARLIMQNEPDLAGFFRTHQLFERAA